MNRPQASKSKHSPLTIYKLGTAAILLLTAAIGLIAFLAFFEKDSRYFENSPAKIILYAILALAVIFALSAFFTSKKIGKIEVAKKTPYKLSLIPAATAIAVFTVAATEITKGDNSTISIVIAISLLPVALYHLSDVFKFPSSVKLALGYVKIIFCILLISKLYLDFNVELNSPLKLLAQFSAVTAVLSILSDLRILINRASTGYFICAKIGYLTIPLLGAIGALTEVVCNLDKYGIDLLIYPIYFLSAAIPTAVNFFTASASTLTNEADPPSESAEKETE